MRLCAEDLVDVCEDERAIVQAVWDAIDSGMSKEKIRDIVTDAITAEEMAVMLGGGDHHEH